MKENFNEDIIDALNRMALLLQKDNEFIENLALSLYNKYCIEDSAYFIIKKEIFIEEEPIATRVLRNALIKYSKSNYDFEMKHIYEIFHLAKKNSGKLIHLPNGIYAENIYGDIYIKSKVEKYHIDNKIEDIILEKNNINTNEIILDNFIVKFEVITDYEMSQIISNQNKFTKYFDFDKIKNNISMRNRRNGDKIIPLGMTGNKKVKDIFIDMKIPKDERDSIPILCFDNKIAWIIGIKISEEYKITDKSGNILKVVVERKEY